MECGKFETQPADDLNTKIYILIGGIGTLIVAYRVYKYFYYLVKEDDFFTRVQWHGGSIQRQILVLGLDGAGKTRLLQCFDRRSKPWVLLPNPSPSFGASVKSAGMSGIDYHFWDVCYDEEGSNWSGVVGKMDVLLWVVDGSNPDRLVFSNLALHRCVQTVDQLEREAKESDSMRNSYGIPIVIVATKQDLRGSMSTTDILHGLQVDGFRRRHKVYIVGTQVPSLGKRAGLWRLFELISWADRKRYS